MTSRRGLKRCSNDSIHPRGLAASEKIGGGCWMRLFSTCAPAANRIRPQVFRFNLSDDAVRIIYLVSMLLVALAL